MAGLETVAFAVIASVIYSLSFYLKSRPETFDWIKFCATGITGLLIGVFAVLTNMTDITEAGVVAQLGVFSGATAIIETYLKLIWRKIKGE